MFSNNYSKSLKISILKPNSPKNAIITIEIFKSRCKNWLCKTILWSRECVLCKDRKTIIICNSSVCRKLAWVCKTAKILDSKSKGSKRARNLKKYRKVCVSCKCKMKRCSQIWWFRDDYKLYYYIEKERLDLFS